MQYRLSKIDLSETLQYKAKEIRRVTKERYHTPIYRIDTNHTFTAFRQNRPLSYRQKRIAPKDPLGLCDLLRIRSKSITPRTPHKDFSIHKSTHFYDAIILRPDGIHI